MKSDHAAHLSLVHDAEQNHQPQHQVRQANKAAEQRKHEKNMRFWHRIKSVVIAILLAASAIYLLIHWG